ITGAGAYTEEIRTEVAARDLSNVSFLGALEKDSFRALLNECDVGLALYRKFSPVVFPTKIVDYMLAGLGVITSAQGEGAEILTRAEAGYSIPAEDSVALVTALRHCSASPKAVAALKANSARLSREFDQNLQIGAVVEMMLAIAIRAKAARPALV
ncbi:MAG: glycosyltransferase, partial [Opitutaceae bacterium]